VRQRQVHWRDSGTPAITWSACRPQPDQVTLPQERHIAGLHMMVSSTSVAAPSIYPRGYLSNLCEGVRHHGWVLRIGSHGGAGAGMGSSGDGTAAKRSPWSRQSA
jgi:hypothetical protein